MSHVWRFLKDCEGWTWRNGGKLDGPFLYFHRDAPDLAFPNQEEVSQGVSNLGPHADSKRFFLGCFCVTVGSWYVRKIHQHLRRGQDVRSPFS